MLRGTDRGRQDWISRNRGSVLRPGDLDSPVSLIQLRSACGAFLHSMSPGIAAGRAIGSELAKMSPMQYNNNSPASAGLGVLCHCCARTDGWWCSAASTASLGNSSAAMWGLANQHQVSARLTGALWTQLQSAVDSDGETEVPRAPDADGSNPRAAQKSARRSSMMQLASEVMVREACHMMASVEEPSDCPISPPRSVGYPVGGGADISTHMAAAEQLAADMTR